MPGRPVVRGRGSCRAIAAITAKSTPLAGVLSPVSQMLCIATAMMPETAPARSQKIGVRSLRSRLTISATPADEGNRGRNGEQQPAFGRELQVLVVGVVEEKLPRAFLIDEHAPLERAGADAGEPEVLDHPPRVAPDRAASPHAGLGRLLQAHAPARRNSRTATRPRSWRPAIHSSRPGRGRL